MKRKTKNFKIEEDTRRKLEINQYGRLLSLRPSIVHNSKKTYNRQQNKKEASYQIDTSFFISHYFVSFPLQLLHHQLLYMKHIHFLCKPLFQLQFQKVLNIA